jgi:superfamily II DNA or RNA helicase
MKKSKSNKKSKKIDKKKIDEIEEAIDENEEDLEVDSEDLDEEMDKESSMKDKKKDQKKNIKKEKEIVELKQHQLPPIEYIKKHRSLILYHSTGSGKTITAIKAMTQFEKNIIIIGPKSSKKAFFDDIKKLDEDASRFKFYTFTKIKKLIKDTNIDILADFSVIVDEAHNLRNETNDNMMLVSALELVEHVILLTATPVINYLNDLSVLVNIVHNRAVLPTDIKTFNASYYDEETGTVLNKDILSEKLKNSISYYDRKKESADYPESDTVYVDVEMNSRQLEEYRFYMKKFVYDESVGSLTYKIDFENMNAKKKNFFLSATRQLSNTIDGDTSFPKIQEMYSYIKKGPFPCVVYSNYLKNGVHALTPLLERDNRTYKTITGSTTNDKIDKIVDLYNKGRYDVLLITSAGSESLDLKNTRQIHIMEPHWNESRIKQVIGRVIRYKSHESLIPENRHVMIYRWCSVFPRTVNNRSADQYLIELSKKKDGIFKQFSTIIRSVSIETDKMNNNKKKGGGILDEDKMYRSYRHNKRMYFNLEIIENRSKTI